MGLTPYVVQGGEQVYQQPFICQNALFYGMILSADKAALQVNVCDRYFNNPMGTPGRFEPVGPFVMLALCKLDKLLSQTPPYSQWGSYAEQEIAFWVLMIDHAQEQIYYAFPYIWVDNAYALSMGREIYGFPKQLGQFVIPPDHNQADYFELQTLALNPLDPSTMGAWQKVLEVQQTVVAPPTNVWSSVTQAAEDGLKFAGLMEHWWDDVKLIENLFSDLTHGNVPFAFLKQFRDVADGSQACYQAVIETTCRCTAWHGGGLLGGEYQVNMETVASEPIVSDLGLGSNPIKPQIAFWCSFDFWIGNGTEVWKAS